MKKKLIKVSTITVIVVSILLTQNQAFAQDAGKPALRSVAYYSIAGGAGGMVIGLAYWMLDPLAPGADLRGSLLQGYGVGVFLGFVFGVLQLNRQAVFPYQEEINDEFKGEVYNTSHHNREFLFAESEIKKIPPSMQLINYELRF
ncbi:hypothetical protein KJ966_27410 [bacterium]|nr:hypothetical protein [bacterium]